jgi:hypothetical protein
VLRISRPPVSDRQHFPFLLARGEAHGPQVADRGAAQRAGDRGAPADPAGEASCSSSPTRVSVRSSSSSSAIVTVAPNQARALSGPARDRPPWRPSSAGEVGQLAVDLAHALAAVDVVAVLAAVAVARGPRDDRDDLGPLGAEQVVVARPERGEAGGVIGFSGGFMAGLTQDPQFPIRKREGTQAETR